MAFTGMPDGYKPLGWRPCDAILQGFVISGSAPTVQPANPTGTNGAKFLDLGNGLILFKFWFIFDANTVFGTGEHIWAVRLPIPANRASGGADLTDGTCLAWQGAAANPQLTMALRPSLMDPMLYGGNQGMEDYFIQFFCPYLLSMGTGSIASASTSTTVTHNLGSTPSAFDIQIMPTATTTTNPGVIYINNIGPTTFQVNTKTAPGAGGLSFAWKARMEPNGTTLLDVLANHTRPWLWAAGHQLTGTIVYEGQL